MTSANVFNYQSEFFLRALGLYLLLKDRITNVNLHEFDYHVTGKRYKGIKVNFFVSRDCKLTDKESVRVQNWDNKLGIYLKYKNYGYGSPDFDLARLELNNAESEISNLINLFENICENVSLSKYSELSDNKDIIDVETLAMFNSIKDSKFFKIF